MKIPIFLVCIAAAVGPTTAAPCNTAALGRLLGTSNVRTCRADTGYNPASMTTPSNAQVTAVCNSDACMNAIDAVKQAAPNECTIGPWQLYADVLNPLSQRCGTSRGSNSVAGSVSAANSACGTVGSAAGSVGSLSAAGSVGSLSAAGSAGVAGSDGAAGSAADNTTMSAASASVSGPTTQPPATNTRQPTPTPTTQSPSSGAADVPPLSTFTAVMVLAAVIGAIV